MIQSCQTFQTLNRHIGVGFEMYARMFSLLKTFGIAPSHNLGVDNVSGKLRELETEKNFVHQ